MRSSVERRKKTSHLGDFRLVCPGYVLRYVLVVSTFKPTARSFISMMFCRSGSATLLPNTAQTTQEYGLLGK